MMAIAALLATSSSVNANIYAATGSTAKLAESGMFPPVFGQLARVGGTRGLVISVLAVLRLVYFVDLTAIASLGSAVALAIFLITSIAAYRLRAETGSRAQCWSLASCSQSWCSLVFGVQTLRTEPVTFVAIIAILVPGDHPRPHLEPHTPTARCGRRLTPRPSDSVNADSTSDRRGRPSEQGADRRTHDDVTGVVDAGVDARKDHDCGGRPQRQPEPG